MSFPAETAGVKQNSPPAALDLWGAVSIDVFSRVSLDREMRAYTYICGRGLCRVLAGDTYPTEDGRGGRLWA